MYLHVLAYLCAIVYLCGCVNAIVFQFVHVSMKNLVRAGSLCDCVMRHMSSFVPLCRCVCGAVLMCMYIHVCVNI
jgi:hypothetical protein